MGKIIQMTPRPRVSTSIDKRSIFVIDYVESDLITYEASYVRAIDKSDAKRVFIQKMNDKSLSIHNVTNVEDLTIN